MADVADEEYKRLLAIAAAMPKTGDGVEIVPLMTVWIDDPPDVVEPFAVTVQAILAYSPAAGGGFSIQAWSEDEANAEWSFRAEKCYSTREHAARNPSPPEDAPGGAG